MEVSAVARRTIVMEDRDIDLMEGLLKALKNVRGDGGIDVKLVLGEGLTISHRPRRHRNTITLPTFWARLTAVAAGEYDWRQQQRTEDNQGWEDMPEGLASTEIAGMHDAGKKARSPGEVDYQVGETDGDVVLIRSVMRGGDDGELEYVIVDGGSGGALLPVRFSAFDPVNHVYTGVKRVPNNVGGYEDTDPAVQLKVFEVSDFIGVELGATVHVQSLGSWDGSESVMPLGTAIYGFEFVRPREPFAVSVAQIDGANGNGSTVATWAYKLMMIGTTNVLRDTDVTPLEPTFSGVRLGRGPVTPGTYGTACYHADGSIELLTVNEEHGGILCGS